MKLFTPEADKKLVNYSYWPMRRQVISKFTELLSVNTKHKLN